MPLSKIVQDSIDSSQVLATAGIKFPATQSASADANTLDDYEEGTWTPDVRFGGGNTGMTYTAQKGTYVKVGKAVYFTCYVYISAKGSSTGAVEIRGLPFSTPSTAGNGDLYLPFCQRNAVTASAPIFAFSSDSSIFYLYTSNLSGGSPTPFTHSGFGAAAEFNIQGWYQTTA